jgi:glycosyltransferase involved in cell wall biosynthesis
LKYLQEIDLVLHKILHKYSNVEFVVIADKKPVFKYVSSLTFVQWNAESEIQDLLQFDIGIMPLPNDEWTKGKCGFKALQYMALELPAVASPVGVNLDIFDHGVNGYLCNTPSEWEYALRRLIEDPALRMQLGARGRKTVVERYSVISNTSNFLSLFE